MSLNDVLQPILAIFFWSQPIVQITINEEGNVPKSITGKKNAVLSIRTYNATPNGLEREAKECILPIFKLKVPA